MKVNFEDVVDAIEMASEDYQFFYNRTTGEVLAVRDPSVTEADEDRKRLEEIEENWMNYERVPTKYDINEYHVMETFIKEEVTEEQQGRMEEVIRGKGAFRRFREMIRELGVEEEWYGYRDMEYRRLAEAWCERLGISWQ